MQRRTAGSNEVPIEADAIGLFLSETEPGAPRGSAKSAPTSTIFEVVPVGEATIRTSEWQPAPPAVDGHQAAPAGRIRRGVLRVGRGIVFLILLPFRAIASLCAAIAAAMRALAHGIWRLVTSIGSAVLAVCRAIRRAALSGLHGVVTVVLLPVRLSMFVTAQVRLGITLVRVWMGQTRALLATAITNRVLSFRAWVAARKRALHLAVRAAWARVVAVACMPVRAWAFVTAQLRLGVAGVRAWMLRTSTALATDVTHRVSSFRAWVAARRRAFEGAVRAGWARVVAVACLPVRAWAFVTAQLRLGVARVRAWMLRTRTALATAAAATRRSLAAAGHAVEDVASSGRAQAQAVACQAAHGIAVVHARGRAASRTLVDIVAAGNLAVWRSIGSTGRSLQDSGHLLTQALQSSRVRLLVPAGAGVEQVRNRVTRGRWHVRGAGPALAGDAGPAWLLTASTIAFFAIASWHQPGRGVAPVAPAVPQPKAIAEAVVALGADPATVAPALATIPPRPAETVPEPRPAVAKADSPTVAPRVARTPAVALDALSVPMIWGGVDVRTLQDQLSALARQDVASSRCEVSRPSSTRAKAVCTGLLSSATQPGNVARQPDTRSWTIDLQQAEDRWQIVKVAAR
jgi:hypothetical protein